MLEECHHSNIVKQQFLLSPADLLKEFPASSVLKKHIRLARDTARKIIQGQEQRLLVVVGPCSIHDITAAYEFAERLAQAAHTFRHELFIIMRVYFEKPRTTVGWKGLISDPKLDGSFDMNDGLKLARKLLLDLAKLGMPAATEFLDPIIPNYLSDLITWSAIGARTVESQLHREIASHLPTPVGFKNTTDGNIQIAIDAANTARHRHHFLSINSAGEPVIVETSGNDCTHIVLRGSNEKTNYAIAYIKQAAALLKKVNLPTRVMIDCSHGNSMKNQRNQIAVAHNIAQSGYRDVFGIMLESNLVAGNQRLEKDKPLVYGQSITDECLSWQDTYEVLQMLAATRV